MQLKELNIISGKAVHGEQRKRVTNEAKYYFVFLFFYTWLVLWNRFGLEGVSMVTYATQVSPSGNV